MEKFELKGENGIITVGIEKIFGFPNETCFKGGYECIAGIEINEPELTGKLREKIFSLPKGETYTVKYYRQGQVRNAFVIKD